MEHMFNQVKSFITSKIKFRKLNSTIPSEAIKIIEEKYHFSLPTEYRDFISKIGNGGILPELEGNITKLAAFDENMGLEHVQEEFLLQDSWYYHNAFQNHCQLNGDEFLETKNKGYLPIASSDCCNHMDWILIITGTRRGEVWLKDDYGLLRLPNVNFNVWLNLYWNHQLFAKVQELSAQERIEQSTDPLLPMIEERMKSKRCECIKWNPPISIKEVKAFELENNIALPTEYVEFISKVADGCSNFFATNNKNQGGTMFCLKDFCGLKRLGSPFLFDKNTEEIRSNLFRNYNRHHTIWQSDLFANLSKDEAVSKVWASPDYSRIPGVLPFAVYNDTGIVGMNTQALLVLNGPLKGQIWKATKFNLIPDGEKETLYTWLIRMMDVGVI